MKRLTIVAALLALVATSGCAALAKKVGLRVSLKDKPVKSLKVSVAGGESGICPGNQGGLVVIAVLEDGSELVSVGAGSGKVSWDNYQVVPAAGAGFDGRGMVTADPDPRITYRKALGVQVTSVHHPKITASAVVPMRYDCKYVADFGGDDGLNGADGAAGVAGEYGRSEQSTGDNAKAGGHGQAGGRGGNGQDGEAGRRGDDLAVEIAFAEQPQTKKPLLQVVVTSETQRRSAYYVVDPAGGSLLISARGGSGGKGGNGGLGGRGGGGGTGAPNGNGGDGGDGGDGANGADGADGGRITVSVDPKAKAFLSAVVFENEGGGGGPTGTYGVAGGGGSTYSGGKQGRDGHHGRPGTRAGRNGRGGPQPTIKTQAQKALW